jgi:hypothetical protein
MLSIIITYVSNQSQDNMFTSIIMIRNMFIYINQVPNPFQLCIFNNIVISGWNYTNPIPVINIIVVDTPAAHTGPHDTTHDGARRAGLTTSCPQTPYQPAEPSS